MISFIIRRLLQAVPVLFIVVSVTFLLVRIAPGSPFSSERALPPAIAAILEQKYKLNGTLGEQYGSYIWQVAHGDLGLSTKYLNRSVNEIVAQTVPVSIVLGAVAYTLALLGGIVIGTFAAVQHNRWGDRLLMLAAIGGISVPIFVLAPILVIVFSIWWGWLPVAGWGSPEQVILPALCLSLPFLAAIARLTRSSLLEVLNLDFVRTARAKGLPEGAVLFGHALPVAILPIIGFSGPAVAGILTGSIVIETVFAIPGIGQFFVNSVLNRDVFMTCGVVLLFSAFLIVCNLVADILYFIVDRRVKLE